MTSLDPIRRHVCFIIHGEVPYCYDFSEALALPSGLRYRNRFDKKWVESAISDNLSSLTGKPVLIILRNPEDNTLVPARWGRLITARHVGKIVFFEYRLGEFIAVSTCCESKSAALTGHDLAGHGRLVAVQHHLSHAALAFYGSGYERALVAVIDGGGNTLDDTGGPCPQWWRLPREQASYYVGTRSHGLTLVAEDFREPLSVGLGEVYRAFTYFLGWHSSTHANRTMALAGHGDRRQIRAQLFAHSRRGLESRVPNRPADPIGLVAHIGETLGIDFGEPRMPGEAILRIHRDTAAFVQREIESALLWRLSGLKREFKVDHLCIAGGLAHNVVLNGRLLELFPKGVYVPSAPGDEGQCLGNIYAVLSEMSARKSPKSFRRSIQACIGPIVEINSAAVAQGLKEAGVSSYVVFETTDFAGLVAKFLVSGSIVCLFQHRSEFGPRALGSRSILADPRRIDVAAELNTLKRREWFMPFAPAVLRSRVHEWFGARPAESPFMSFARQATPEVASEVPAVVNADHSSRVQTVDEDEDSAMAEILISFAEKTGVPGLLNTSFNHGGEPIVESIPQALSSFKKMPINVLNIGRFVVVKSLSPNVADLPLEGSLNGLDVRVARRDGSTPVDTKHASIAQVIRRLQELTGSVIFVRMELPLYGPYLGWLREGRKVTTIRFRKGAIEIPHSRVLPLYKTDDYSPGDRTRPTDHVVVKGIRHQVFGELSDEDAQRDGFTGIAHMRHDLHNIYPTLTDDSWVTIYNITLAGASRTESTT